MTKIYETNKVDKLNYNKHANVPNVQIWIKTVLILSTELSYKRWDCKFKNEEMHRNIERVSLPYKYFEIFIVVSVTLNVSELKRFALNVTTRIFPCIFFTFLTHKQSHHVHGPPVNLSTKLCKRNTRTK